MKETEQKTIKPYKKNVENRAMVVPKKVYLRIKLDLIKTVSRLLTKIRTDFFLFKERLSYNKYVVRIVSIRELIKGEIFQKEI